MKEKLFLKFMEFQKVMLRQLTKMIYILKNKNSLIMHQNRNYSKMYVLMRF